MTLPTFVTALRADVERSDPRFQWIKPSERAAITEALRAGFDAFEFGEAFQAEGRAQIGRSVPLFLGPKRSARLTAQTRASVLLFDPETPETLRLALGPNLPPALWPEAAATLEGLKRDLDAYLERPFRSAHRLSASVRIARGSLEDLGLEDIATLARVIGYGETWIDGAATWKSGCVDDPWSDDTAHESMLTLRVQGDRAAEEHGQRFPSISMRTLWSRSILTIEQGPFQHVVFEFRYDPVAAPSRHPFADETVPSGIPVDLFASLLRGSSVFPKGLEALKKGPMTPYIGLLTCLLEPAEVTTVDLLRSMLRDPELRDPGLALASNMGARTLLYELECETDDDALRARLAEMNTLRPAASDDESDDDDNDDDDDDENDDDYDDDDDDDDDESDDEEESL